MRHGFVRDRDIISRPRRECAYSACGFCGCPLHRQKPADLACSSTNAASKKSGTISRQAAIILAAPGIRPAIFLMGAMQTRMRLGMRHFSIVRWDDHIATDGWTSMSGLAPDGHVNGFSRSKTRVFLNINRSVRARRSMGTGLNCLMPMRLTIRWSISWVIGIPHAN